MFYKLPLIILTLLTLVSCGGGGGGSSGSNIVTTTPATVSLFTIQSYVKNGETDKKSQLTVVATLSKVETEDVTVKLSVSGAQTTTLQAVTTPQAVTDTDISITINV